MRIKGKKKTSKVKIEDKFKHISEELLENFVIKINEVAEKVEIPIKTGFLYCFKKKWQ